MAIIMTRSFCVFEMVCARVVASRICSDDSWMFRPLVSAKAQQVDGFTDEVSYLKWRLLHK